MTYARLTGDTANLFRPLTDPDDPFHTFMFELSDGRVIDAAEWLD